MEIKLKTAIFFFRRKLLMIIMRTFIFLFFTTVFGFSPNNMVSQNSKIKIEEDKILTVDEVFDLIMQQTDYKFIYQEGIFKDFPKIEVKKGIIRTNKLLELSISSSDLNIELTQNNTILIKRKNFNNKDMQLQISGKVTDMAGLPLPGVTVLIKGSNKGGITDLDGNYTITVPNEETILVFSSQGFTTQEIVVGNRLTINIALKESLNELEVVTINAGYYKTSKRQATGSISKVESKVIEEQSISNPIAALQGRMSGVYITPANGLAVGSFKVQIRGQNSIASGNEPLYIIDGVPFGSQSMSSPLSSGILQGNLSPFSLINPSDIESVEVLKDADATAIYGSRGANGIILITTKKGKEGKTTFDLNFSTGIGRVANTMDLLNTEQYLEMRKEAFANDGVTPQPWDYDLSQWDQNRYTDWQDKLLGGTAYTNDVQASVSGGNDRTQFRLGGGYHSETTVYPDDNKYIRGSALATINHSSNDDRFSIAFSANYSVEDNTLPVYDLVFNAISLAPNAPELYDDQGNLNWENGTWTNPLAELENSYASDRNNLLVNSVLSYKITPNLELKTNLGYNNTVLEDYSIYSSDAYNPAWGIGSESSTIIRNNATRRTWNIEPQIKWENTFGKSKLSALLGTTFEKHNNDQLVLIAFGFPSNRLIQNISAASFQIIDTDDKREYKYNAFFGRLNYNFNDTYIINLTARRDGSSRFGPNKQFANFGAVGAAWVFSNEKFLKENDVLSFGKLRGSYGSSGNDQIGDYQFLDTYNITGNSYNGVVGLQPSRLFNPDFAWEVNKKLEFALELGLLKNRIQITNSYYKNISTNQLVGIPLPSTTGFRELTANLDAKVKNTGFELDLQTINFQKDNFNWTTSFNITVPKNELVKFPGLEESTFANQYAVGESLSIQKLYNYTGINPDTGIYEFEDYNNDGIISSPDDRQFIEDTAPKFYGGFSNNLNYKNWDFNIFFHFAKQKTWNYLATNAVPGAWGINQPTEVLERWQQPGDQATIQLFTAGFNSEAIAAHFTNLQRSNRALTDASFIRLKNVSLGYTIPEPVLKGVKCRFYLQAQNLFTFTNYLGTDPEQAPQTLGVLKRFNFGAEINF